jgi:hypothetical protein
MKTDKETPKAKEKAPKELDLNDLEKVSGGGDNPFKDVPRVISHNYDDTVKGKI